MSARISESSLQECQPAVRRGFTLIELLVVIAIISILATILIPALAQARDLAQISVCVSNLKSLGVTETMYASDNDGNLAHIVVSKGWASDYYGENQRYVIHANDPGLASTQGRVNFGLLVDDYMGGDAGLLFCPAGDDHPRAKWEERGGLDPGLRGTLYSSYSRGLLTGANARLDTANVKHMLASDCNTALNYSLTNGQVRYLDWANKNVAAWHPDKYNVMYFDGHVSSLDYNYEMFAGKSWYSYVSWYSNWNCFNYAFHYYVVGK